MHKTFGTALRALVVASLSLGVLTVPNTAAVAADTQSSFTVESATSPSDTSVSQAVGTSVNLKFSLTVSSSTEVSFSSTGVGSITSATSEAGFSTATDVTGTSLKIIGGATVENIETITVTSAVVGTQTVTASYLDPITNNTSTKTVTISWTAAPTTGILLSYSLGGVLTPSRIEAMWNQNGRYLYAENNDYSVTSSGKKYLIDIAPGSYTIRASSYDGKTRSIIEDCVVVSGAVATCNIELGKDNFPFRVLDQNSTELTSDSGTTLLISRLSNRWYGNYELVVTDEQFNSSVLSLSDGTYSVNVFPNKESFNRGDRSNATTYEVVISSKTVASVKAKSTGIEVPLTNEKYSLTVLDPNFKAKVLAGTTPVVGQWVNINNRNPVTNEYLYINAVTSADGQINARLPNGINTIYIYNWNIEPTKYINTFYNVTVVDDSITSVINAQGNIVTPTDSSYPLNFTEANISGTLTIDGKPEQGYVQQVFDLDAKKSVSFEASYVNSEGKYGVFLPTGNYRILIQPYNGLVFPVSCQVVSGVNSTCNATGGAKNLSLQIEDATGSKISDQNAWSELTSIVYSDATRTESQTRRISIDSGSGTYFVPDGDYSMSIGSDNTNRDGSSRKFKFTVTSGAVSQFTDTLSNEVVSANAQGIFRLKLLAPNFKALISANGSANPGAGLFSYQPNTSSNNYRSSRADSTGLAKINFPDGLNKVTINPTNNETPTVVSVTYDVLVSNGAVTQVSKSSGETLTVGADDVYTLSLATPNIIGTVTLDGSPVNASVYGAWNTVLNSRVDFQTSGVDQNGNYSILVPAGNYDFGFQPYTNNGNYKSYVGGVVNCNATAEGQTRCDVQFPAENLKINLKNGSGTAISQGTYAYVNSQDIPGHLPGWWGWNLNRDASGQLTSSLLDGKYILRVGSSDAVRDGSERSFLFEVTSGIVSNLVDQSDESEISALDSIFSINLKSPNFKATVIANGAANPNVWTYGYARNGKTSFNSRANLSGQLAQKLQDGTYDIYVNATGNENPSVVNARFTVVVDSGTVTSVIDDEDVTINIDANGFYPLVLGSPNLTGTISIAGKNAVDKDTYIQGFYSKDLNRWVPFKIAANGWLRGSYAVKVAGGDYLIAISQYQKSTIFVPCSVAATGNSTCDLSIPENNFKFKIQDSNGVDLLTNVASNGSLTLQNTGSWFNVGMETGGKFETPVQIPSGTTGYYTFNVYSTDGSSRHGISTPYKVVLDETGTSVSSVTNQNTGETVTVTNEDGYYRLKLTSSNITGTVVAMDGATQIPIPNASVCAYGQRFNTCMGTDSSGAFAARTNIDGTYQVFAMPPTFDTTKAQSATSDLEVTNGGGSPLTLTLRTPNMVGTVRAPGIADIRSAGNYIQVLQDDGFGNFNYVDQSIAGNRPTDSKGKFAFNLGIGKYKFRAQSDASIAGSSGNVSEMCEINAETLLAENVCDFRLRGINTKIQVLGAGARPHTKGGWINYWFTSKDGNPKSRALKWSEWGNLNGQGQSGVYLDEGVWRAQVYTYEEAGNSEMYMTLTVDATGVVTSVVDDLGNVFAVNSDGYYEVQLPTPNLIGTVTFNQKQIKYGAYVYLMQESEYGYQYSRGQWINSGKFSFNVPAGNYVVQVNPYPDSIFSTGNPVSTRNESCEVLADSVISCDVDLKTGNLRGRVTDTSGNLLTDSYAYAYRLNQQVSDKSALGKKFYNFDLQINMNNGQFASLLNAGEYIFTAVPGWGTNSRFTQKQYKITVDESLTVTVSDFKSNVVINPDSKGNYAFALSEATVRGKVLKVAGSNQTVSWAQIIPLDLSDPSGNELWDYATNTNYQGEYVLTLPDGTYDLVAKTWGGKDGGGSSQSAKRRITIAGDVLTGDTNPVDLTMQTPNLSLKVLAPSSTTGVPYTYVNGNFNSQFFGGMTDSNGELGVFIDTATSTTCSDNCYLRIYPWNNANYTEKTYATDSWVVGGAIRTFEVGSVNCTITIRIPTNGEVGLPNAWGWAMVEEIDETGTVLTSDGFGSNQLGQIGLGLTENKRYRITAYPSGDYFDRYSPKVYEIASFVAATMNKINITFDSPNITLIVSDTNKVGNSWGWYEVKKAPDRLGEFVYYSDGYLNGGGRAALKLTDGAYRIKFNPGKASGITKEVEFVVTGGHAVVAGTTNITFVNDVGNVVLDLGNLTGVVRGTGTPGKRMDNIQVTATSNGVDPITLIAITDSNGNYYFNLDANYSWSIKALDPITGATVEPIVVSGGALPTTQDLKFN